MLVLGCGLGVTYRGHIVDVEVCFFDTFAMVALRVGEAKETFLKVVAVAKLTCASSVA